MTQSQHPPQVTQPSALDLAAQQEFAQQALAAEAQAISHVRVGESFHHAVDLILRKVTQQSGSVVVTGMGKSGLIGQKLSATFSSTGTPSHFLHPSEALHGDLGRVRRHDVVLALSYGGQTEEVVDLATILKQDNVPVIAIVGKAECDLGRLAAITLEIGDVTEACPLRLAPTASTTAMLALGDALALAVSRRLDFTADDFKRLHPGGGLGRQLLTVGQAMRFRAGENLPLVPPTLLVHQAFDEAEQHAKVNGLRRAGALIVASEDGTLAGILTDGDLRRLLIRMGPSALGQPIGRVMTPSPRRLLDSAHVREAVQLVREYRIDEIPVVDAGNRVVGMIDIQDLIALKVIDG